MGPRSERRRAKDDEYKLPKAAAGIARIVHYAQREPSRDENELPPPKFKLGSGVHPFGPPEQYEAIANEAHQTTMLLANDPSYEGVDDTPSIEAIQERWKLGSDRRDPYIVISHAGSFGILKIIHNDILRPRFEMGLTEIDAGSDSIRRRFEAELTEIAGIQPQFPWAEYFTRRHLLFESDGQAALFQKVIYRPFTRISLETPFNEGVKALTDSYLENPKRNLIISIANPNSPTGDVANPSTIRALADACVHYPERLLVIDEAFGDMLPDEDSAIPLTKIYPNLIVTRSVSKGLAMPRRRLGFAVMSPRVGELYERLRDPYDLEEERQLILNKILNPEIIRPYLASVREKVREVKIKFVQQLRQIGAIVAPTSDDTPFAYLLSGNPYFQQLLREDGIETASGFAPSEYDITADMPMLITTSVYNLPGRCARMTIPKNEADIPEIVEIVSRVLRKPPRKGQEGRFP